MDARTQALNTIQEARLSEDYTEERLREVKHAASMLGILPWLLEALLVKEGENDATYRAFVDGQLIDFNRASLLSPDCVRLYWFSHGGYDVFVRDMRVIVRLRTSSGSTVLPDGIAYSRDFLTECSTDEKTFHQRRIEEAVCEEKAHQRQSDEAANGATASRSARSNVVMYTHAAITAGVSIDSAISCLGHVLYASKHGNGEYDPAMYKVWVLALKLLGSPLVRKRPNLVSHALSTSVVLAKALRPVLKWYRYDGGMSGDAKFCEFLRRLKRLGEQPGVRHDNSE